MTIEETRKKIDNLGNIKVIFEPRTYDQDRIQKKDLQDILEKSSVSLRGWSFPHIPIQDREDTQRPSSIGNGVEFYVAWQDMLEIFRFYQSGQFLAKFAMREDTLGEVHGKKIDAGRYLDFLSLIYRVTEITLFIKNLIENTNIEGGTLTIELHNVKDREIESLFSHNIFPLHGNYKSRMSDTIHLQSFDREKILTDPLEIARNFIKDIFYDFNWKSYSEQMIRTHQENLINRRF